MSDHSGVSAYLANSTQRALYQNLVSARIAYDRGVTPTSEYVAKETNPLYKALPALARRQPITWMSNTTKPFTDYFTNSTSMTKELYPRHKE